MSTRVIMSVESIDRDVAHSVRCGLVVTNDMHPNFLSSPHSKATEWLKEQLSMHLNRGRTSQADVLGGVEETGFMMHSIAVTERFSVNMCSLCGSINDQEPVHNVGACVKI